jgi:hypothetical protein
MSRSPTNAISIRGAILLMPGEAKVVECCAHDAACMQSCTKLVNAGTLRTHFVTQVSMVEKAIG